MNQRFTIFYSLLVTLLFSSCVSTKDVTYFQPATLERDVETVEISNRHIARIQPGDILSVMVSSLSKEASAMFNPFQSMTAGTQRETAQANGLLPATGYLVDEEGSITLPLIGKVEISGLTTLEAMTKIRQDLDKYLQQPTVSVRILNYKVSVIGEVVRPSVYTIPNEKISLPEALSLAGDLTIYGKRDNIMVIREVNGTRQFARVDLTKRDIFSSPYFYLHANDIVYVEPTKGKVTSSDRAIQLAPIVMSGLSLLVLIISNVTR